MEEEIIFNSLPIYASFQTVMAHHAIQILKCKAPAIYDLRFLHIMHLPVMPHSHYMNIIILLKVEYIVAAFLYCFRAERRTKISSRLCHYRAIEEEEFTLFDEIVMPSLKLPSFE